MRSHNLWSLVTGFFFTWQNVLEVHPHWGMAQCSSPSQLFAHLVILENTPGSHSCLALAERFLEHTAYGSNSTSSSRWRRRKVRASGAMSSHTQDPTSKCGPWTLTLWAGRAGGPWWGGQFWGYTSQHCGWGGDQGELITPSFCANADPSRPLTSEAAAVLNANSKRLLFDLLGEPQGVLDPFFTKSWV